MDLFMFHLNKMEIDIAVGRLKITGEMPWSNRAMAHQWGSHQREPDLERRRAGLTAQARELMAAGAGPFEFSENIERLIGSLYQRDRYWYGEHRAGRFSMVPEEFWNLV